MSTILAIDDDAGLRSVLMRFLAIDGFVPIGATNGQEALDYLRGGGPADAIVLDLRMPVMDGWTFRRKQREDPRFAGIPVIVLAGADSERLHELGAEASFPKPAPLRDVVAALRGLCARA